MALAIWYNKSTLKDAMIIVYGDSEATSIETNDKSYVFKNGDQIERIVLNNVSRRAVLSEGFLFPSIELAETITKKLGIDLQVDKFVPLKVVEIVGVEVISNSTARLCTVTDGNHERKIVCGASNAKLGLRTIAAFPGTVLPDGKIITSGKVYGQVSEGMLCSAAELGLENNSKGEIIEVILPVGSVFNDCFTV